MGHDNYCSLDINVNYEAKQNKSAQKIVNPLSVYPLSVYSLNFKSTILVNIRGKTSDSGKEYFVKESTVKNVKWHEERT